jgi:hypothetical protein
MKYSLLLSSALLFSACSTTTVKNRWQFQSVNAFESSKVYYLQNEQALAATDLKRAKKYAKQSADLTTLSNIELSQCALHVSVLEDDNCSAYTQLLPLAKDENSYAYYLFLQNQYTATDIPHLPKRYQTFALYKLEGKFNKAETELLAQDDILSKTIMAALIKDELSTQSIKLLIKELSFNGYKKAVVSWLQYYSTRLKDNQEIEKSKEKLRILQD